MVLPLFAVKKVGTPRCFRRSYSANCYCYAETDAGGAVDKQAVKRDAAAAADRAEEARRGAVPDGAESVVIVVAADESLTVGLDAEDELVDLVIHPDLSAADQAGAVVGGAEGERRGSAEKNPTV
jgi:hypothetical protein